MNNNKRIDDYNIFNSVKNNNLQGLINYIKQYNNVNKEISYYGIKGNLIHIGAQFYFEDMFDAILSMEPELDIKDSNGNTALHIAVKHNNYYAMEKLIQKGATIDLKDNNGFTPIMNSLLIKSNDRFFSNYRYLTYLHEKNASLISVDNENNTLLHIALLNQINNLQHVCEYLINNGVEVNSENKNGLTPLEIINDLVNRNELVKDDINLLNKKETELLTIHTRLIVKIMNDNPELYENYFNVDDIKDNSLIKVNNITCLNINGDDDITGYENEEDCNQKGGEYKKVNNNMKVKFELTEDGNMYFKKFPKYELAINKIKENAKKEIIITSNENQYPGEYINRDTEFLNFNNGTKMEKFQNITVESPVLEKKTEMDCIINLDNNEIKEGFQNAEKEIKTNYKKTIVISLISIILALIFAAVLYNLMM